MSDTAAPEAAAGHAITELLAGFIQELRQAGLPVSLTENLDAMEAVKHIPLDDREAFKYALAATLVKNNSHWRAFETVFEVYFSLRGSQYRIGDGDDDALAELLEQLESDEQMDGDGPRTGAGGGEGMTPEEIVEITEIEGFTVLADGVLLAAQREVHLEDRLERAPVRVVLHERRRERVLERLAVGERDVAHGLHRVEVLGEAHR